METKICKQCGKLKPESNFRHYYGGRSGTYKTCLDCERINTREKYLRRKQEDERISQQEKLELDQIHALYSVQRSIGLQPPRTRNEESAVVELVMSMMQDYSVSEHAAVQAARENKNLVSPGSDNIPDELKLWLNKELTEEPEYYQDTIYEELREKYRPIKEIDKSTMLPVYDDTYRFVLDRILKRFDEYEDKYYA
jgi:hypothetical protein